MAPHKTAGVDTHSTAAPAAEMEAVDPVCGMAVDPATTRFTSMYAARTFWFCCAGCKKAFDRKPGLYFR